MQLERRLCGEGGPLAGERELFHLVAPVLHQPGGEGRWTGGVREHGPVLAGLERLDLGFPVGNEAKRRTLHPAGREAGPDLRPEHRRQVEPDQVVERAARELRVHQIGLKLAGMFNRLADRAARNFMKLDPVYRLVRENAPFLQQLRDVPGDRLALAIRVGGQVQGARAAHRPHDRFHVRFRTGHQVEVHREAAVGLDRPGRRYEIAHVAV